MAIQPPVIVLEVLLQQQTVHKCTNRIDKPTKMDGKSDAIDPNRGRSIGPSESVFRALPGI